MVGGHRGNTVMGAAMLSELAWSCRRPGRAARCGATCRSRTVACGAEAGTTDSVFMLEA